MRAGGGDSFRRPNSELTANSEYGLASLTAENSVRLRTRGTGSLCVFPSFVPSVGEGRRGRGARRVAAAMGHLECEEVLKLHQVASTIPSKQ